jgi:hypothetical protein
MGAANLNAGTGAVVLTADNGFGGSANNFNGNVTLTAGNADFLLNEANGINRFGNTAGSTIVSGILTIRSPSTIIMNDFNLANGLGGFELTAAQLDRFSVGTLVARASGVGGDLQVGTFNPTGVGSLELITAGNGGVTADGIMVGTLSITSGGTVSFTEVGGLQNNTIQNLGAVTVAVGGFDFQNRANLNLTGRLTMPGRLSMEVAGQFYNNTGQATPLSGVAGGSVIKSLSLFGAQLNSTSGLQGFSSRYDAVMPTSGNVMSYAVSPLALFAPSGTIIAGVDLSGTQTGGGQLNTLFTGSDDLNWVISDFGKFNLPKVSSAGLEYAIYPKRVEPVTRSLSDSTLAQLRQELGRPPTIDEINRREVSMRESDLLRSGSILERSSFDSTEERIEPQENAKATAPLPTEGQVPQANQVPKKGISPDNRSPEALPPLASSRGLPFGSVQGDGSETASELLLRERAKAEVGLSIPVAHTQ